MCICVWFSNRESASSSCKESLTTTSQHKTHCNVTVKAPHNSTTLKSGWLLVAKSLQVTVNVVCSSISVKLAHAYTRFAQQLSKHMSGVQFWTCRTHGLT